MPFNRQDHSVIGEIRPRFKLKIGATPEKALDDLESCLVNERTVSGDRSNQLIFLRIPSWDSHYWSPEITVRIEQEEYTDFTTVSCLVGPRQSVWAMFTFLYAAIILFSTFGGIFGLIKYQETGMINWLWIIPAGVLLTLSLFITSKMGQQKGRDQMLHLVSFLYHSLDSVTDVERLES